MGNYKGTDYKGDEREDSCYQLLSRLDIGLPRRIPNGFFPFLFSNYWPDYTLKGGIAYAWVVNMSDHGIMDTANKTEACYVWSVRAGK